MSRPERFPTAGLTAVQEVLAPWPGRPADLYLGLRGGAEFSGSEIRLDPGAVLDFGRWFNAFYLGFWSAHGTMGPLAVQLRLEGRAQLSVEWRAGPEAGEAPGAALPGLRRRLLLSTEVAGNGGLQLHPLGPVPDHGHLALVLRAQTACQLHEAAWMTLASPRAVRLSLGICTFRREDRLAALLESLEGHLPEGSRLRIVNQAGPLSNPRLRAARDRLGALCHDQPNLGGAGGFARSMAEALEDPAQPTHHLLMDDDVTLDPRLIGRLARALAFLRPDRALGGAMIEAEHPRRLHEAGADLLPMWLVRSHGRGRDLGRAGVLQLFDRAPPVSYNAWWFCCLPLEGMRRAGLPQPLFIRGDDIEYGCRLRRAGVLSVSLPGMAVWHDSFAGKTAPWLSFYDFRNLLIGSARYPGEARPPSPLDVLGALFFRLLSHDYRRADAVMRAVRDFLSGPGALRANAPGVLHAELRETLGADGSQPWAPPPGRWPEPGGDRPLPPDVPGIIRALLLRFCAISLGVGRGAPLHHFAQPSVHPGCVGPGPYLVRLDPEATRFARMAPSRRALWPRSLAALALALRYGLRRRRAAERWRVESEALATRAAWEDRFRA